MAGKFPPEVITAARASAARYGLPASVSLAQWAVESSWGRRMPAGSNNPFGIKARAGEPSVGSPTHEVVNGTTISIVARFRKFANLTEAFEGHDSLIATRSPYAAAMASWRKDRDLGKFISLMAARYATDPHYAVTLKSIINTYNLSQYDKPNATLPPAPVITPRAIAGYGWVKDQPHREEMYSVTREPSVIITPTSDLRPHMTPAYDQLQLGGCVGNATAAAIEYLRDRDKQTPGFRPSRLFIYYCARALEGTIHADAGCQIHDAIREVLKRGVPTEVMWPYDPAMFDDQPPRNVWASADRYKAVKATPVPQNVDAVRKVLCSGYPVIFGFNVFPAFEGDEVAKTGVVPMPGAKDKSIGGHAVLIVGHSDERKTVLCRNSWGPDWGKNGYFEMPYAYAFDPDLASDFWVVRKMLA